MKKCYHYFYFVDGLASGNQELLDMDSCSPYESSTYQDVITLLDNQKYDIRKSVVKKLVEYAASQFKNP